MSRLAQGPFAGLLEGSPAKGVADRLRQRHRAAPDPVLAAPRGDALRYYERLTA
ncbi:MAG: hypothetical protein ABSE99_03655 [Terracidiphilus sp.]